MRSFVVAIVVVLAAILGVQASSVNNGGGSSSGGGASVSALNAHFANTITVTDHNFHQIGWDTTEVTHGTGISLNTSTGVITFNAAGYASITATILFNTTNSSQGAVFISGSAVGQQAAMNNAGSAFGGSSYCYTGAAGTFYVSAGDTFTVSYGQQGSGGTSILGGQGNNGLQVQLIADGTGGGGSTAGSWCDLWLTAGQSISNTSSDPVNWTGTSFTGSALSLATDTNSNKYVAVAATGFLTVTFSMVTTGSETGAIPEILRGTGLGQQQFFNVFASNTQDTWTVSATMHVLSGDKIYCQVTCPSGSNTLKQSTSEFIAVGTYATMTFTPTSN